MEGTFDLVIEVTDRNHATTASVAGVASGSGGSGTFATTLSQD